MIIFVPTTESKKEAIKQPKFDGVKMPLEEFQNWEPDIEEGIKYEWNNGIIEATDKLRTDELFIYTNIQENYSKQINSDPKGFFISEVNIYLQKINKIRRPDIIFINKEKVKKAKKETIIPEFVIEIVSDSNSLNEVEGKIREYFEAGVKLVWIILPIYKEIKVYTSIKDVKICTDNDICNTDGVISNFFITVNDIFAE